MRTRPHILVILGACLALWLAVGASAQVPFPTFNEPTPEPRATPPPFAPAERVFGEDGTVNPDTSSPFERPIDEAVDETPVMPAVVGSEGPVRVPPPGTEPALTLPKFNGTEHSPLGDEGVFASLPPLRQAWFLRLYYLKGGDLDQTNSATSQLRTLRDDTGIENASPLAAALAQESRRLAKSGQSVRALEVASDAVALAPDLPAAHIALARAQLSAGKAGAVIESIEGAVGALQRNLPERARLLGRLMFVVIGALLFAAAVFVFIAVFRHARAFLHDLGHALSDRVPGVLLWTVAAALFAFPLILGLGPAALALWLCVLLWIYLRASERIVALSVVVMIATLPFLMQLATSFAMFSSGETAILHVARDDEPSRHTLRSVKSIAKAAPTDVDVINTLGTLYKRRGDYTRALELFEHAAQFRPDAWSNVGVVQYGMAQPDAAMASFRKAIEGNPRLFSAHYNLSLIHFERSELEQAEGPLKAALAIDPSRGKKLRDAKPSKDGRIAVEGRPYVAAAYLNRLMVEEVPDNAALVRRARRTASAQGAALAAAYWSDRVGGVPLPALLGFGVAAAFFMLLLTVLALQTRAASPCEKCGSPVCVLCDGPARAGDYCQRCAAASLETRDIDQGQKKRQQARVDRRRRFLATLRPIIAILIPGGGHFMGGHAIRGGVLATLAAFFALAIVAPSAVLPSEYPLVWVGTMGLVISLVGLAGVVLISFLGARKI